MAQLSCIFCGSRPTTKEHYFGKWTKQYFSSEFRAKERGNHTFTKVDESGKFVTTPGVFRNSGHPISTTTRVVCRSCNNEWGGPIEEGMKDAYERIRGFGAITAEQYCNAKKWAMLKLCLEQRAYGPENYVNASYVQSGIKLQDNIREKIEKNWRFFRKNNLFISEMNCYIFKISNNEFICGVNHLPFVDFVKYNDLENFELMTVFHIFIWPLAIVIFDKKLKIDFKGQFLLNCAIMSAKDIKHKGTLGWRYTSIESVDEFARSLVPHQDHLRPVFTTI